MSTKDKKAADHVSEFREPFEAAHSAWADADKEVKGMELALRAERGKLDAARIEQQQRAERLATVMARRNPDNVITCVMCGTPTTPGTLVCDECDAPRLAVLAKMSDAEQMIAGYEGALTNLRSHAEALRRAEVACVERLLEDDYAHAQGELRELLVPVYAAACHIATLAWVARVRSGKDHPMGSRGGVQLSGDVKGTVEGITQRLAMNRGDALEMVDGQNATYAAEQAKTAERYHVVAPPTGPRRRPMVFSSGGDVGAHIGERVHVVSEAPGESD